jgi:hypothetical protein
MKNTPDDFIDEVREALSAIGPDYDTTRLNAAARRLAEDILSNIPQWEYDPERWDGLS